MRFCWAQLSFLSPIPSSVSVTITSSARCYRHENYNFCEFSLIWRIVITPISNSAKLTWINLKRLVPCFFRNSRLFSRLERRGSYLPFNDSCNMINVHVFSLRFMGALNSTKNNQEKIENSYRFFAVTSSSHTNVDCFWSNRHSENTYWLILQKIYLNQSFFLWCFTGLRVMVSLIKPNKRNVQILTPDTSLHFADPCPLTGRAEQLATKGCGKLICIHMRKSQSR